MTLLCRYGIHICLGGIELDTKPRKGVERFQYVILIVLRHGAVAVQQPGLGHTAMLQIRDGEFADAVVPVGMPCPLHIERLRQVEGQLDTFALQLIHNAAVVDAPYWDLTTSLLINETLTACLQIKNIHDRDAKVLL